MSSNRSTILSGVRVGLVVLGGVVTALTVHYLTSMPSPPPGSDGFAQGMAAMFAGGIILLSLGIATIAIVLPSLLGCDDHLGFNRWQRLSLKAAGALIGLGVVSALLRGLDGIVELLGLVVLAFAIVCVMLLWRLAELVVERQTTVAA